MISSCDALLQLEIVCGICVYECGIKIAARINRAKKTTQRFKSQSVNGLCSRFQYVIHSPEYFEGSSAKENKYELPPK